LADLNIKAQLVLKSVFNKYVVINCNFLRPVVSNAADGHLYHNKHVPPRGTKHVRENALHMKLEDCYTEEPTVILDVNP